MIAPRLRLRPLRVTLPGFDQGLGLLVPAQIFWAAALVPGEWVEVHDVTTGATFHLPVAVGRAHEVQVNGCAAIEIGHSLALAAARRAQSYPGCTVCLCERNRVIEIRDASAPPLPEGEPPDCALVAAGSLPAESHLSLVNLNPGPPRETCPDPGGGRQTAQ